MINRRRQRAVELLRQCSDDAKCNNNALLQRLKDATKRKGEPSPHYEDEDNSHEERTMLPTPDTLNSAIDKDLLRCKCQLCQPLGREESESVENEFAMLDSERLKDYAVLILCGCLFITRHSAFATVNSLMRFVMKYSLPGEDDHLSIFGKIAGQPSKCRLPHDGSFVKWNEVEHMKDVCNPCRWKAFKDAYELKRRIVSVYHLPQKMTKTTTPTTSNINILNLSDGNLPFVNQTELKDIKNSTLSLKFYSCKVHPLYIDVDPELRALDGVEIFRKVYRYQPLEKQRIEDAKEEARIAFVMSRHKSVAPLLFAFSHDNRIYEVIELLYERKKGTLDSLLLGGLLQPAELVSIAGHRVEMVDNVLWGAMINIVEAVVAVHSSIESLNPLDIKPANILVGTNEKGEFALYLTDFGHIAEKTPRKAAVEYAPPLLNIGAGIGKESPTKYDVWSMACMLLQVLVFIDGKCEASELKIFNTERQEGFKDAAFWTDEGGKIRLRKPVLEMLKNLEKGSGGSRTFQVVEKIREMFSIDPDARDTMEGCLESSRTQSTVNCQRVKIT